MIPSSALALSTGAARSRCWSLEHSLKDKEALHSLFTRLFDNGPIYLVSVLIGSPSKVPRDPCVNKGRLKILYEVMRST